MLHALDLIRLKRQAQNIKKYSKSTMPAYPTFTYFDKSKRMAQKSALKCAPNSWQDQKTSKIPCFSSHFPGENPESSLASQEVLFCSRHRGEPIVSCHARQSTDYLDASSSWRGGRCDRMEMYDIKMFESGNLRFLTVGAGIPRF